MEAGRKLPSWFVELSAKKRVVPGLHAADQNGEVLEYIF